jgi:hypothetical protein
MDRRKTVTDLAEKFVAGGFIFGSSTGTLDAPKFGLNWSDLVPAGIDDSIATGGLLFLAPMLGPLCTMLKNGCQRLH